MARGAYCVCADGGRYAGPFKDGGYVTIGWMPDADLSDISQNDTAALGAAYDSAYPSDGKSRRGLNLGQIRRFLWGLKSGDVVVTPMDPPKYLLVGVVNSGYYYDEVTSDKCPYPHRRKVEWLDEPVLRSSLSVPIQHVLRAALTVFEVWPPDELLEAVGLEAQTPRSVQDVEENVSNLVLERLLELDADEFEILVTELLTALGFEAEKTSRPGDGGVDVEGTLDVHGPARADLKVQAKRYMLGSMIDHETVNRFRASVPEKAQGAFVTTGGYTKKARETAEREGFKRIGLIDGEQLVGILNEQYDGLSIEMRERLGLRRALVPS